MLFRLIALFCILQITTLGQQVQMCPGHTDDYDYLWDDEDGGQTSIQPCSDYMYNIGMVSKHCGMNGEWGDLIIDCVPACPAQEASGFYWKKTVIHTNLTQECPGNSYGAVYRVCSGDALWLEVMLVNCTICLPEVDQEVSLEWVVTGGGIINIQQCPPYLGIGFVRRSCNSDGSWGSVDISGCKIPTLSPPVVQCPGEVDSTLNLLWSDTDQGIVASQDCPPDFKGYVTRRCSDTGSWDNVIFANCTITTHQGFRDLAEIFFNNKQRDIEIAIHLVKQYAIYTSGGKMLTHEELDTFNFLACNFVSLLLEDGHELGDDLVDLIDNVLHPNNIEGWQDLQSDKAGSEELLYNAEAYGYYLAKRNRSTNADIRTDKSARERFAVYAKHMYAGDLFTNITFRLFDTIGGNDNITQIMIPGAYLESVANSDNGEVSVIFMAFTTLQDLLPITTTSDSADTVIISAQVVTTNDVNIDDSQSILINYPIEIKFAINVSQYDSSATLNVTCVYWNFSSDFNDVSQGGWISDDTVSTHYAGGDVVSCTSTHLTSFSVLVDVAGSGVKAKALTYISYIGCGVSIVCLLLTILVLLTLCKEIFTQVFYFIHLNLAISLLLGLIVFVSGIETAASIPEACKAVAVLLHYFFLCAFSWMLCEGIMLYLMLVVVFSKMSKRWWIYLIIGWGLPVIPVAITLGVTFDNYERKGGPCWLNGFYSGYHAIWGFVGPMLAIICVNCVILVIVIIKIAKNARRKRQNAAKGKKGEISKTNEVVTEAQAIARSLVVSAVILLPLLGITWIVGLFAVNDNTIVFAYAFTILNSLQGVFIFFFHVIRSKLVWGKIKTHVDRRRRRSTIRSSATKSFKVSHKSTMMESSASKMSQYDEQTKESDV